MSTIRGRTAAKSRGNSHGQGCGRGQDRLGSVLAPVHKTVSLLVDIAHLSLLLRFAVLPEGKRSLCCLCRFYAFMIYIADSIMYVMYLQVSLVGQMTRLKSA